MITKEQVLKLALEMFGAGAEPNYGWVKLTE